MRTLQSQRFEIKAPAVASHRWRQFCCTRPTNPRSLPSAPRIDTRLSKFPLFRKRMEKAAIVVARIEMCEPKLLGRGKSTRKCHALSHLLIQDLVFVASLAELGVSA